MARAAPVTKNTKPMVAKPKPGHPAAAMTKAPAKPAKAAVAAKPVAAAKAKPPAATPVATRRQAVPVAAPAPAPKLSKDELRAQVEKLEQANAALRMKSQDTNKATKAAAKRIAELEAQVAQLEKAAAARPAPANPSPKPKAAAATPGKRRARAIDPGDAVLPGVAVKDPAPMDEEAEAALETLE